MYTVSKLLSQQWAQRLAWCLALGSFPVGSQPRRVDRVAQLVEGCFAVLAGVFWLLDGLAPQDTPESKVGVLNH